MIAFSRANTYFKKLNACLIGLSVDSNSSHLAWAYDIFCKTGIRIPFPIIADRNSEISRKYGMISSDVSNTETVRNVYIIDDKGIIRLILIYPSNGSTPANWVPCEPMIIPPPKTFEALIARNKEIAEDKNGMSWYLSFKNPESCNVISQTECNRLENEKEKKEQIN